MLVAKHIAGIGIVVEAQLLPALVSVAFLALDAVATLVGLLLVNLLVAGVAFERGVFVSPVEMTFLAFHIFMLTADEREVGFFVIEGCFLPVLFAMATGAFFAQLPLVYIVFLVAGVAIGWRFPVFFPGLVTALALHFLVQVPALQLEIGLGMVKFPGVEYHYMGIAAHMVSMAGAAFLFFQPAMEPLLVQNVLSHLLVATFA